VSKEGKKEQESEKKEVKSKRGKKYARVRQRRVEIVFKIINK